MPDPSLVRPRAGAIIAFVLLSSCSVDSSLFGKSSGADTGGGAQGTAGPGGGSTSGGAEGGASQSGSGAATATGPGPGPSSSSAESATASSAESSAMSSSSSGRPDLVVDCGGSTCGVDDQSACCWDEHQLNGQPQAECVSGPPQSDNCDSDYNGQSGAETRIECQLPSHCPGAICCGERVIIDSDFVYYASTTCQQSCDFPSRVLCGPLDAAFQCPFGTFCQTSNLLPPGYNICGT